MIEDIRRRTVRAIGASGLAGGLGKLISLLSTLVLARILAPEDFGLLALATTVTGLIGYLNEVGIGASIVQRQNVSPAEINGCFGIALLTSGALAAVTFLLSWPAASFFAMPALQPVIAVIGFGFLFGALNTVPAALLRREMRLQAVLWLGVVGAVVQSLVAIPLAMLGLKHWALVGAFFTGSLVATVWYWRVVPWRPTLPLRLREGRKLFDYGLNITYTRLLWHLYTNVDKLIVGKLLGERAVGVYDMGKSLAGLPATQVTGLVTAIALPVFANLQTDPPRLRAAILRLTRGVAYLMFPALAGLAVVADDLVDVLLGAQWHAAVVPLQALCVGELVRSVAALLSQVLISTGNVRRLVRYSALCAVVLPSAIAFGAWRLGLLGVSLAWAVVYPVLSLWLLREVTHVTGVRYRDYGAALRQPVLGATVMTCCVFGVDRALDACGAGALGSLIVCVATGVLVYSTYVVFFDRGGMAEIRQVLGDFGVPQRLLNRWPFVRRAADG